VTPAVLRDDVDVVGRLSLPAPSSDHVDRILKMFRRDDGRDIQAHRFFAGVTGGALRSPVYRGEHAGEVVGVNNVRCVVEELPEALLAFSKSVRHLLAFTDVPRNTVDCDGRAVLVGKPGADLQRNAYPVLSEPSIS
jgi:hypothetical protein